MDNESEDGGGGGRWWWWGGGAVPTFGLRLTFVRRIAGPSMLTEKYRGLSSKGRATMPATAFFMSLCVSFTIRRGSAMLPRRAVAAVLCSCSNARECDRRRVVVLKLSAGKGKRVSTPTTQSINHIRTPTF